MKRLIHPEIGSVFEFRENAVNTLVVENQSFFRKTVSDLYTQTIGNRGDFVLSEDYSPVNISQNIELITQFVPFEINRKNLIGKICTAAEANALGEKHYKRTQELVTEVERFFDELLFDYPFSFEYSKLNITNLLKSAGILISENYDNELEKIKDYLLLSIEFEREKIYVFVNMRSFFADEELEAFLREMCSMKVHILLIDNVEHKKLSMEKRVIIDKDLCEIY